MTRDCQFKTHMCQWYVLLKGGVALWMAGVSVVPEVFFFFPISLCLCPAGGGVSSFHPLPHSDVMAHSGQGKRSASIAAATYLPSSSLPPSTTWRNKGVALGDIWGIKRCNKEGRLFGIAFLGWRCTYCWLYPGWRAIYRSNYSRENSIKARTFLHRTVSGPRISDQFARPTRYLSCNIYILRLSYLPPLEHID